VYVHGACHLPSTAAAWPQNARGGQQLVQLHYGDDEDRREYPTFIRPGMIHANMLSYHSCL
jgi:hypothetical protein